MILFLIKKNLGVIFQDLKRNLNTGENTFDKKTAVIVAKNVHHLEVCPLERGPLLFRKYKHDPLLEELQKKLSLNCIFARILVL
tara:strand:- start:39 stop:290 length:252 start_codon:yes stop_codon:yes gene_type:complete